MDQRRDAHPRRLLARRAGRRLLVQPGGWNRFQVPVDDIDAEVERLSGCGVRFRSAVVDGQGGRQVLADDPSGNPVELFQSR